MAAKLKCLRCLATVLGLASIMSITGVALLFTWPHNRAIARYLLRAAANPNVLATDEFGTSPLTLALASHFGHLAAASEALIEAGASVNYSVDGRLAELTGTA